MSLLAVRRTLLTLWISSSKRFLSLITASKAFKNTTKRSEDSLEKISQVSLTCSCSLCNFPCEEPENQKESKYVTSKIVNPTRSSLAPLNLEFETFL